MAMMLSFRDYFMAPNYLEKIWFKPEWVGHKPNNQYYSVLMLVLGSLSLRDTLPSEFRQLVSLDLGDGSRIRFWEDVWVGSVPF